MAVLLWMADRSMWRSTLIVSFMTLLSRILGMVRDIVLLNVFGAGGLMDAFVVAFKIPNFFRRLFAEGAFSQAFVPVLSEYKAQRTAEDVRLLISRTSGGLTLILSLLTGFAVVGAPLIIGLFAPGFVHEPAKFALAVELLRLTFPYLLLMSLTAFASSVLNSYGSFASAAFAPVLLNVVMIAAAWWGSQFFAQPILSLGWAVLIAGVLQLAMQLPELYFKKLLVWPTVDFADEGVQRILRLMMPALFGVSVVQINLLLNTVWASFMETGSVTWLYSAERMTELPLGLIGIAIATVILPVLSAKKAEGDMQKFSALIHWAAKVILLVGVPASLAMGMLAEPIISALFQHGKFTAHDTRMTALALQGMAASVLAFMLIKIFAPAFYARQDTKTPVRIGLIAVGVNIVANLVLIGLFKLTGWQGVHVSLALSSTLAALVNASLLYVHLHRQGIFRFGGGAWRRLGIIYAAANAVMGIVLALGLMYWPEQAAQWVRVLVLLGLCVAGAAAYGGTLLVLGFRPREIRHP